MSLVTNSISYSADINFYGALDDLWRELLSHCRRVHLFNPRLRVKTIVVEVRIFRTAVQPLNIPGEEDTKEFVQQLVVKETIGAVQPVNNFLDNLRQVLDGAFGDARAEVYVDASLEGETVHPSVEAPF